MDTAISLVSLEKPDQSVDLGECEKSLRRYFSRRVRAQWDVDDLVQESLTRLIHVGQDNAVSQPFGYLFRIANNLLVDRARRDAVAPALVATLSDHDQPASEPDQEEGLHLADLQAALDRALDELPLKCRDAFILRRFHDMDTPMIATTLGVSHRMVQKYLIRAMGHLHSRLKYREDVFA